MPVEAKPLFRPDVLRAHLAGFQMPSVDRAKLTHWASEIASGRIDRFGEKEILPHFLQDFLSVCWATPGRPAKKTTPSSSNASSKSMANTPMPYWATSTDTNAIPWPWKGKALAIR